MLSPLRSVPGGRDRQRHMRNVSIRLPREREKGFLQAVREMARVYGWDTYHTFNSQRSEPGFPDLVLCRPPRLIIAELKTDRGRLTPAQHVWCAQLQQCAGLEVYIWRPAQWDAIRQRLQ
jgi:hypothetical protein